ncbi:MAG: hydroxymethylbilane synthase [Bacteroidales bacterium]|jgi:hydroxymethylbilane synthase|nr:hydroxymethylbilane synthase [Bacteroidales bacterium]
MKKQNIKIGTRGSQLALYQAYRTRNELSAAFPEYNIEIEIIKTKGDKILDVALSKIGDKGLFTKELETALIDGRVDMAVHSLKDLPTNLPEKLCLGGVLERGEFRDALVSKNGKKLSELTSNDVIATSSLRRAAQLLKLNPNFKIVDIRGNVNTRLKKMEDGHCDAMVMAAAGLQRLNFEDKITEVIETEFMIPAVSQGAIAIEIRENDPLISGLIDKITHKGTLNAVLAERVFLNKLEGGCQIPIGCFTEINEQDFSITGFISSLDGTEVIQDTFSGDLKDAQKIAADLAELFVKKGATRILDEIRKSNES